VTISHIISLTWPDCPIMHRGKGSGTWPLSSLSTALWSAYQSQHSI